MVVQFVPYNSIAIANFFIRKALQANEIITPMEVGKLVYITDGWFLGAFGRKLVNEQAEVWPWGPVIRPIYDAFKRYGAGRISAEYPTTNPPKGEINILISDLFPKPKLPKTDIKRIDKLPASHKELLDHVWEKYHPLPRLRLAALTHREGTPWARTKNEIGFYKPIPQQYIREYYKQKLNNTKVE